MTAICFLFMMLSIMAKGVCEMDWSSRIAPINNIGFEQVCQQIEAEIVKSMSGQTNPQYKKCGFGFEITTIGGCNAPPTLGNPLFSNNSFYMDQHSYKRFMYNTLCTRLNLGEQLFLKRTDREIFRNLFQFSTGNKSSQARELILASKSTGITFKPIRKPLKYLI